MTSPDYLGARSVDAAAPDTLPAWEIFRRPADGPSLSMCAVGDIGLSGRVADAASRTGWASMFGDVVPVLRSADICFGNLETPVIAGGGHEMFKGDVAGVAALRDAGFSVLHLANNHSADFGQAGLQSTLSALRANDMLPLGAGESAAEARALVSIERNGITVGWLGCGRTLRSQPDDGPQYWELQEAALLDAVRAARGRVNALVASIHAGLMYLDYPRPEHKHLAEKLLEAGADLVLMHHAHVLQGVQVRGRRLSCYNLGNFIYDRSEGSVVLPIALREQEESAVFRFEIDKNGICSASVLPIECDDEGRVRFAREARAERILDRLRRISADLEGDYTPAFRRQRAARNTESILRGLALDARRGNWRDLLRALRRARLSHASMILRWLFR